jgi:threonine synthase
MPFVLAGYATAACELWEQLGEIGALVVPAGQGGLLLGLARGFEALHRAGLIRQIPTLFGVQAEACAPLAERARGDGETGCADTTIAEGVRISRPLRAAQVVRAVLQSGGHFVRVREQDILPGRDELARLGFYVEPTSALVWPALQAALPALTDPVVALLTGSGYKVSL